MNDLQEKTLSHNPSQYEVLCKKVFAFFKSDSEYITLLENSFKSTDHQLKKAEIKREKASGIETTNEGARGIEATINGETTVLNTINNETMEIETINEETGNGSTTITVIDMEAPANFEMILAPGPSTGGGHTLTDILDWPGTPKRKGTRKTERIPFVLTSDDYKNIHREKENKKKEEDERKENRKKERENRQKLKSETTKRGKGKKNATNIEHDGPSTCVPVENLCYLCGGSLMKGPCVTCSTCAKIFHRT
ncbi:hypothetical protein GE061_017373 [Apolygus lucorum]|uniref:Uncharacterized protein n=1 Tax=Apolygus lucorum TaxID=248454 RepID=A0A8S9XD02_APOLU|nr:hypothetical protein GE061_017373 [Apolygus lucorum]